MKRFILLFLLTLSASASVMAQKYTTENTRSRGFGFYLGVDRDTLQYIVASPFDNWFIEAGGGLQTYIGNEFEDSARWNPLSYHLYAEIGKWVIPDLAFSVSVSAWGMQGQTRYGPHPFVDFTEVPTESLDDPHPGSYYKYQRFNANGISLNGSFILDWTNLFNGYEKGLQRRLHVMTPIGLGYSMLYGGQKNPKGFGMYNEGHFRRNFELDFRTGLLFEFKFNEAVTLNFRPTIQIARQSLDWSPTVSEQAEMSGIFDIMPSLTVAMRFNFIRRVTKVDARTGKVVKVATNHMFQPAHNERIQYLESRIDTIRDQMTGLEMAGDAEAAASAATINRLNHLLDSLNNLLAHSGSAAPKSIDDQIDEINTELSQISASGLPDGINLSDEDAQALLERQQARRDRVLVLERRLRELQRMLDRGRGDPYEIVAEIDKLKSGRDELLAEGLADNLRYGIGDNGSAAKRDVFEVSFMPLDVAREASESAEIIRSLNYLIDSLNYILTLNPNAPKSVRDQIVILTKERDRVKDNSLPGAANLKQDVAQALLVRQDARRDSVTSLARQVRDLQEELDNGRGNSVEINKAIRRIITDRERITAEGDADNRAQGIYADPGRERVVTKVAFVPYEVAREAAATNASIMNLKQTLDSLNIIVAHNPDAPSEVFEQIEFVNQEIERLKTTSLPGAANLTADQVMQLLSRQGIRRDTVAILTAKIDEIQTKLDNGRGNRAQLSSQINRLKSDRERLNAEGEADNRAMGLYATSENTRVIERTINNAYFVPYEVAREAAASSATIQNLNHMLDSLNNYVTINPNSPKIVFDQIENLKKELARAKTSSLPGAASLTTDNAMALIGRQSSRRDSVAIINGKIQELQTKLESGRGNRADINDQISRLKGDRERIIADGEADNRANGLYGIDNGRAEGKVYYFPYEVAREAAASATSIRNLNKTLDSLKVIYDKDPDHAPQELLDQIDDINKKLANVKASSLPGAPDLSASEAVALMGRQSARRDSVEAINAQIDEINTKIENGRGNRSELNATIARLKADREKLLADGEADNRAHGLYGNGSNAGNAVPGDRPGRQFGIFDPYEAAREAAARAKRLNKMAALNHQLDSLQNLLEYEITTSDPMLELSTAIERLHLPMTRVFYQLDKSDLDYNARKLLHEFALAVKKGPADVKYYIIGAADAQTGTPAHNVDLSKRRCQAVYDVLTRSYGISPSQFEMFPLGGITEYTVQENNRTAIIVLSNSKLTEIIDKWGVKK